MRKFTLIMLGSFLLLAASGCVRRVVIIDSQPQGAEVYLDRKLIGQTPCTHEFLYYGGHNFEMVKEGYANFTSTLRLKAPIYEYFPLSLFSEIIFHWQITDEHSFNFKLEEGEARKPIISPIEQPQPSLPLPHLERVEEKEKQF